ncbi:MAG: FAD:protein FMN transferase [Rhodanobacteraceae bacterium]|nr:FAD:protein FMN transferase [Rhodanobacteraceae bacterium]
MSGLLIRHQFRAMGCPCSIQLEHPDARLADAAIAAAIGQVERLDRKYSHYRDDSLLADWCASAGSGRVFELDAESAALFDLAALLHAQSGGLFDITAGALTRLWDRPQQTLPEPTEIDAARACIGWQHLSWQRPLLRLALAGLRLDLGGLVKEYAADRAAQACIELGIAAGVVELGGDVRVMGPHLDGSPWRIGIRHPRAAGTLARIDVREGGLATSGDYERALIVDGRRYSHIVDPRSGWPIQSYASVSVRAASCLAAGAAATLAMLLGVQAGTGYLRELGLPHLTVDLDGVVGGEL